MDRIERVAHDFLTTMATRALLIAAAWLLAAVVAVAAIIALLA
jgi:hypothetical protein